MFMDLFWKITSIDYFPFSIDNNFKYFKFSGLIYVPIGGEI